MARSAMALLEERYCEVLLSPQFSEIGISRDSRTWRVVLAQPLLSPNLGDSFEAGKEVLELVNKARSAPRSCGTQRFGSAPGIEWNTKLASAALAHEFHDRNAIAAARHRLLDFDFDHLPRRPFQLRRGPLEQSLRERRVANGCSAGAAERPDDCRTSSSNEQTMIVTGPPAA